jgi:hypothetical protein
MDHRAGGKIAGGMYRPSHMTGIDPHTYTALQTHKIALQASLTSLPWHPTTGWAVR